MNLKLDGRRALVCGASRGIGRAVAQALANSGAEIVAVARDAAALEQVLATLSTDAGQKHQALALDLSDSDALAAAMLELAAAMPVQIVINNTGGPAAGPAIEADPAQFEAAFAQHVLAAQRIARALLPGMKTAGYGRIINIISTSVKEPIPGLGVSNTIRGAMASWSKTMSRELGPMGITVNNVLPGFTATERLEYIFQGRADKSGQSIDAVRQQALSSVPAGRFAKPAEIANAVAFLASPAAAYINGINLPVDGGRTGSL
ncbi:MAG: SDR family oxidoreductase [Gammaproteobacteria bacterium]